MKKTLLVAALALGLSSVAMAQENGSQDRAQMRAEMVQKNAERLAKDFELKGDAKSTFLKDFVAYQNELMGTIQMPQREQGKEEAAADKKKELTEAEAKAKIQESFERQEKMVAQMQKRLDIQKKYYESFSKILTPQQMVRIFNNVSCLFRASCTKVHSIHNVTASLSCPICKFMKAYFIAFCCKPCKI